MKNAILALAFRSTLSAAMTIPEFFAGRDCALAGGFVAVGDVTGNGIPDVVAVTGKAGITTLLGNGYGSFSTVFTTVAGWLSMGGGPLVDLNGDGKADLVTAGATSGGGGIGILFSNGDGTFQQPVLYPVNDGLGTVLVGDFNGDGIPDVIAAGGKGLWLFTGQGGGTFNASVLTPISSSAGIWVTVADFNLDGNLDAAVSISGGVYTLLGNGNGTFQAPVFVGSLQGAIIAAATTRDGYPDIVSPGAGIYLNPTFAVGDI
jgi:hypothetical protein